MGVRFREMVEGPFGFLDSALWIVCAMVFLRVLKDNGAWDRLFEALTSGKRPVLNSFGLLFFLALPGMLTGCASAGVLLSAPLAWAYLKNKGAKKGAALSYIMSGVFLGMLLPPNSLPAMIASNGAGSVLPTPYVGFFLPLLVLAAPAFIVTALLGSRMLKPHLPESEAVEAAEVFEEAVQKDKKERLHSLLSLSPLMVVGILLLMDGLLGSYIYVGGQPVIYAVGLILAAIFPYNERRSLKEGIETLLTGVTDLIIPVAAMLALGTFIEVSSMSGVRGVFSLFILPYSTTAVMLVCMAAALLIGYFLSAPLPAFLITYAVFPIGWLANTVIVTGCAAALGLVTLISPRGGLFSQLKETLSLTDVSYRETVKGFLLPAVLVLLLGIVMVIFGDSMTGLIL